MIARRKRASKGRRQEYSYSPMIWVNDPKGRRQHWGGSFKTLAEARAEERRLLMERDRGNELAQGKITVSEVFDQYLDYKHSKVKASSFQRSEELLAYLRPLLGYVKLSRLKAAEISKAYSTLEQRLAKRTVKHCHWQLHGALDIAVKWGQAPFNVAARVDPPEPEEFVGKALTPDELMSLLAFIRGHALAPMVLVALDSGAREGELLALTWAEIDLATGLVHIGRSVRKIKGSFLFTEPKTKKSRRSVRLSAPTIAVLKAHRQQQLERRLQAGELWQDNDLVFPNRLGLPQTGSAVSHAFRDLATAAGLKEFRFHDLRHSSLSLLLQNGQSIADVSRRAGHAGIAITMDTYGHGLGDSESLAQAMEGILNQAMGNPEGPEGWLANG